MLSQAMSSAGLLDQLSRVLERLRTERLAPCPKKDEFALTLQPLGDQLLSAFLLLMEVHDDLSGACVYMRVQQAQLPPQAAPTSQPVEAANGHFVAGFPVPENCTFPPGTPSAANGFSCQYQRHSHAPTSDTVKQAAYLAPANSQVAAVAARGSFPAQESCTFLALTPPAEGRESLLNHHEPARNPTEASTNAPVNSSFVHTNVCTDVYTIAAPPAAVVPSSTSTASGGSCPRKSTAKRVSSRKKTPPSQGLEPRNIKAVRNATERRRVGTINEGFKKLLNRLPPSYRAKRPTKLSILHGAYQCIEHLQDALAKARNDAGVAAAQPINMAPVAEPRQPMDHRRWANQENVSPGSHQGTPNFIYAQNPSYYAT
ncbi:hypothetical protein HPB50_022137 [Hyalomma asiaticum]|uniref:Uncharacterized protein n=1 Tax=Hyalomma asiaticum TaxID=266040 RepID=A0ACB7RTC0_HYAAI|nr:hypothetical protein HPB50_022137 [Hyalomma asiaticum]